MDMISVFQTEDKGSIPFTDFLVKNNVNFHWECKLDLKEKTFGDCIKERRKFLIKAVLMPIWDSNISKDSVTNYHLL